MLWGGFELALRAVTEDEADVLIFAGAPLSGLAERVALTGGRLEHGPISGGGYALRATLPRPA